MTGKGDRGPEAQRASQRLAWRRLTAAAALVAVLAALVIGFVVARGTGPAVAVDGAAAEDPIELSGRDVLTGRDIDLARFSGKPVVINIWASWCPGCNAEAEALARFARAHREAAFVGVNFQDSANAARRFYDEYGWTFPSIADPDGEIAFRLGLQGTPTTIFLDATHREVTRIVGETDEAGFADALRQATS